MATQQALIVARSNSVGFLCNLRCTVSARGFLANSAFVGKNVRQLQR